MLESQSKALQTWILT